MEEMKDVKVKKIQFGFGEYPLSEVSHNRFYTICDQQQKSV
jgi:hypothetical protein